jgi:hypothetical protein
MFLMRKSSQWCKTVFYSFLPSWLFSNDDFVVLVKKYHALVVCYQNFPAESFIGPYTPFSQNKINTRHSIPLPSLLQNPLTRLVTGIKNTITHQHQMDEFT